MTDLRDDGAAALEWAAAYLERVRELPVLSQVEPGREAEQLGEPGERHLLELLQRGRGAPEDPDLVEGGREELREDSGLGAGRGEVREVPRALPVRETG